MTDADTVERANRAFWSTLCGSSLARSLGIVDASPESLRRFDEWYFRYYPYLEKHLAAERWRGRDVLEVGPGYGSVAQRLASAGARYNGLDVAESPVQMARERLRRLGFDCDVRQGSILARPWPPCSFDAVVAIGSLHHTGDLPGAICACQTLLRPGGTLVLMVYNALSHRVMGAHPGRFLLSSLREVAGRGARVVADEPTRARYDTDSDGAVAPHTELVSAGWLRRFCRGRFTSVRIQRENTLAEGLLRFWSRDALLRSPIPRILGLDLYASCVK